MPPLRVLALVAPGRHGDDAVHHARALSASQPAQLTVAARAPAASGPRCGTSILDFNAAVAQAAGEDLRRARALLGDGPRYVLIREGDDRALSEFVAKEGIELVLLPGRRRRHPQAQRLRERTSAEVRVVAGAAQPASA